QEKAENHNSQPFLFSPGMRLLMNQTLLGIMNGRLEVLATPSDGKESDFNRTQCSIPMSIENNESSALVN
ncbi:MAG: sensor histidine kinase, partial [Okeania sp. SIO4D6]|nr:sensor histidine kinase [Okeania sp. SIO4D6]